LKERSLYCAGSVVPTKVLRKPAIGGTAGPKSTDWPPFGVNGFPLTMVEKYSVPGALVVKVPEGGPTTGYQSMFVAETITDPVIFSTPVMGAAVNGAAVARANTTITPKTIFFTFTPLLSLMTSSSRYL
jgi:hypothetical protein